MLEGPRQLRDILLASDRLMMQGLTLYDAVAQLDDAAA